MAMTVPEWVDFRLEQAKNALDARIQNPQLDEAEVQSCITANQTKAFEDLVEAALIQWRHRLVSPVAVLERALSVAHRLAARLEAFHPGDDGRANFRLAVACYADYLLYGAWDPALAAPLPAFEDRKAAGLWGEAAYLEFGILSELRGSGLPAGWKELVANVASKKREKLWAETSQVYVDLIRAGRSDDRSAVKALARQAAELHVQRNKSSYYSGGIEGGGGTSKDVVDFRLAAILKSLERHADCWAGDEKVAPHLWQWGTQAKRNPGLPPEAREALMREAAESLRKQAQQKAESRDKWVFASSRRGAKYHREECPDFQKVPRMSQIKMEPSVAKRDNHQPCPKCFPV